ncbi:MAG: rod shape-determining protein MreC [Oscillospiraceae bacterium]|jgi:rod shape-determining protein MreC|nr:rod shape-determining protein MreC [Oscillospiraceae bacterium]
MKILFTKKTVIILTVAVLIAISTLISVNVYGGGGPVTALVNAISRPLKDWSSAVARTFESIYGNIYRYEKLVEDYEKVQKELAALKAITREAVDMADELERLIALFDFSEQHSDHEYEQATVLSWSSSIWISSFSIDKGSDNSSIKTGNSVTTEYGVLIGKVTDVGAKSSTVISVLDTTFSAGALIGENGASATVKGDFSLMGRGLLMLDHIANIQPVLPGDAVVTSGGGGVFPPGLVIGEVDEVFNHSTGVGRYATVRPMLTLEAISHVFIITDFDISN